MPRLSASLEAWGSDRYRATLKREIEAIEESQLPLQQGLSQSSQVSSSGFSVIPISDEEQESSILSRVGVMYKGIIAGCSCADDPTPIDEINEYCELDVTIDRITADTTFSLVQE